MQKAALDLGVTSSTPMSQIRKLASVAEHTNVHGIWIGEDIDRGADVFVQASVIMLDAPTKKVGIGVTSPLVRNISTIARAAAALGEIDPARFRLGLGLGGLQDLARRQVIVEKPVAALRDAVDALRRIWAGETLTLEGETFDIRQFTARYRPGPSIPIYLGVRGPMMLRLAAKVADGVVLSGPSPYLKKAIEIVRNNSSGRGVGGRPKIVVWLATLVLGSSSDRKLARAVCATVIADTPRDVMEMAGIPREAVERVRKAARHGGYVAASEHVTAELLDSFTISGDARHIAEVFESFADIGADEVVFGPPYGRAPVPSINQVIKAWDRL